MSDMGDVRQPRPPETVASPAGTPDRVVSTLPQFKLLLHSDRQCDMLYIVETICELTPLNPQHATMVMKEAQNKGTAVVLVTHRELAELYMEQFRSRHLEASIEPLK